MNIFTNDDYRRIQAWLKANSVKDSELPHFTSENGSEKIAILQDGKNVLITLNELKQLIGGIVRVLTPPTISNVDNNVVINAKIGTIYYTVGADYYPYLDSEGNPVDDNTKEYGQPFPITEDVTVRAIAKYTNSEGELLTSEITEELVLLQKTLNPPSIDFENNTVTLTRNNDEGEIYYTLDGSIPTIKSTKYEGPFKITKNCTIYAIVAVDTSVSKAAYSKLTFTYEKIDIPTLKTNLTYSGEEQIAFSNLDTSEDSPYIISGIIRATNADDYEARFTLKNTAETKWKDKEEGISEVKVLWSIAKKPTTITWNTGTVYEVGSKIPVATSSDSFSVKYYRNDIEITLPYVLQNEDIGTLTIVAKNILSEDDKKNYIEKSVTKTFTIKEQSISYEYQFMSSDDLFVILNSDLNNKSNLRYTDFPKENWKPIIEGTIYLDKEVLILSYPSSGNPKLIDSVNNEFATFTVNTSEEPYIKIYADYTVGNTQTISKN